MSPKEMQQMFDEADKRFASEDEQAYASPEYAARFRSFQVENGLVSEPWQPWWLPGDLRLTSRGVKVYEASMAILALLIVLAALAVVGMVEQ